MNFLSSQTIFEALSRRLWFQNVTDVDDVDDVDDVEDFNDSVAEKKSRLEKKKIDLSISKHTKKQKHLDPGSQT